MKTIKESWLNGEIPKTSKKFRLMPHINFAREYFQGWTEKEIRQAWKELKLCMDIYIVEYGKRSFMTTPSTILSNDGLLLALVPLYKKFIRKWDDKFASTPLVLNQVVDRYEIQLALLLLKSAADGDATRVVDIHDILWKKYQRSAGLKRYHKEIISDQNRKNAKASRKSSLRKLIETLFLETPRHHLGSILSRLENQTKKDREVCHVESVSRGKGGHIRYYLDGTRSKRKMKTIPMRSFAVMVSRSKKIAKKLQ